MAVQGLPMSRNSAIITARVVAGGLSALAAVLVIGLIVKPPQEPSWISGVIIGTGLVGAWLGEKLLRRFWSVPTKRN
jgi:hypothetical protein